MGKNAFYKMLTIALNAARPLKLQRCRIPQEIQLPPTVKLKAPLPVCFY